MTICRSLTNAPDGMPPIGRLRDVPMGRFGRPEEVAALAAFLASDHGAWIPGVAYNIDGGYTKASA